MDAICIKGQSSPVQSSPLITDSPLASAKYSSHVHAPGIYMRRQLNLALARYRLAASLQLAHSACAHTRTYVRTQAARRRAGKGVDHVRVTRPRRAASVLGAGH